MMWYMGKKAQGTSRPNLEMPVVLMTESNGDPAHPLARRFLRADKTVDMPFLHTSGSGSVMDGICSVPPMEKLMASTKVDGLAGLTRQDETAEAPCASPCLMMRLGGGLENSASSFDGVRHRAMQVSPASRARRSAARPHPPEAPKKAMTVISEGRRVEMKVLLN